MDQRTIETSESPEVIIETIDGNLQVKGWDRAEISVKADPDTLTLEEQEDTVRLSCTGNCTVRLPHGASVTIETVHGDARVKLLEEQLSIETVSGNLALRNVAAASIETVHGELNAKHLQGSLEVERVAGNAAIRDIEGDCRIETLGGNLELRRVEGEVVCSAGGNADLRLNELSGENYQVSAGGNLQCRLPEDADLVIHMTSGGHNIRVKLPSGSKVYQQGECEITLGDGDSHMSLAAGGNLYLASEQDDWSDHEEPESDFDFASNFARMSSEFGEQIARQVESQIEAQMENLNRIMDRAGLSEETTEELIRRARETGERASARAQEKMRKAQDRMERKLEAARRRSEAKAQAAERRSQFKGRRSWSFEWPAPPPPPPPPPPPENLVSDEERLMILRMLEQKKISLEEAEQLLAALEGKNK